MNFNLNTLAHYNEPLDKRQIYSKEIEKVAVAPYDTIVFSTKAYGQWKELERRSKGFELSAIGELEGNRVIKLHVPTQRNTEASTDMDSGAVANLLFNTEKPEQLRLWIHSHASMSVFWSSTDTTTIKTFICDPEPGDFLMSVVTNLEGKSLGRIDFWEKDEKGVVTRCASELNVVVDYLDNDKESLALIEQGLANMTMVSMTVDETDWNRRFPKKPKTRSASHSYRGYNLFGEDQKLHGSYQHYLWGIASGDKESQVDYDWEHGEDTPRPDLLQCVGVTVYADLTTKAREALRKIPDHLYDMISEYMFQQFAPAACEFDMPYYNWVWTALQAYFEHRTEYGVDLWSEPDYKLYLVTETTPKVESYIYIDMNGEPLKKRMYAKYFPLVVSMLRAETKVPMFDPIEELIEDCYAPALIAELLVIIYEVTRNDKSR